MSTILVVEDEKILNDSLTAELKTAGFEVVSARDGKEGLELIEKGNIDLILLDIVMPKMDGVELLYHMRQRLIREVPIIVLTNLDSVALPEGVDQILLKANTDPEQIVEIVKQKVAN